MKNPCVIHPKSAKKVLWVCDCGREKKIVVHSVTNGYTTRCGMCNVVEDVRVFGKWTLSESVSVTSGSEKKVHAVCACGNSSYVRIADLFSGKSTKCGKCSISGRGWYEQHEDTLKSLKLPVSPNDIPPGWTILKQTVESSASPFLAECGACGGDYFPIWNNFRRGMSITCGCSSNRISTWHSSILEFINSLGVEARSEFSLNGLKYDIAIPEKKIIMELNGLRWHSMEQSKRQDKKKYENALNSGFNLIVLFDDEWRRDPEKVKNLICNRIGLSHKVRMRGSKCIIRKIGHTEADVFHEEWHYIGAGRSPVNYGAFVDGKLVACASFRRPTRQSVYEWELSRMSSRSDISVHGVWSKILSRFCLEHSPSSIVSFSDNRLFDGRTYSKIGFLNDGQVSPDYYWTDGKRRWHKSAMRKSKEEIAGGLSETELRVKSGLRKVWDFGKTRWVYRTNAT